MKKQQQKIERLTGYNMTTNHGIYRHQIAGTTPGPEKEGICRCGILQVFSALASDAITTNPSERTKAVNLEYHHREIFQRLIFSLQNLNGLMQELGTAYSREETTMKTISIALEAGCHADHILTYLNTIIDDIACAIILTTEFPNPPSKKKHPIDSMGRLKECVDHDALKPVSTLLTELNSAGSWWELAFKPKIGGRQLLIHNQALVTFQGYSSEKRADGANAFLSTPFAKTAWVDFFELLRNIFAKLFDWLDRLELAMVAYLQTKSSAWHPRSKCPSFTLPVGLPYGTTTLHPDYFVLPLCDGSNPLPWTITVR